MQISFNVYRKEARAEAKGSRANYTVELADDASVLDGLLKIRDEIDPTLAFRASCLRGYCGECTIRANGKSCFACTTRVSSLTQKSSEVTVDPVRNMPVVKDLVSDWDRFLWSKIDRVQPWLQPSATAANGESIIADSQMADVRKAMSCYYCGLCDEGCTVLPVDFDFIGPAALTKAYRFTFDPRDTMTRERFKSIEQARGLWDCVHCFEASEHCPRGIAPTERIMALRDKAFQLGIQNPRAARHHYSFADSVKKSGVLDEGKLAVESEGLTNVRGLLRLLPIAARALRRGKAPIPYLHHKSPGTPQVRRIIQKAEEKNR
jgi:succinate dehydrogenase / fumarate reductase, iron-sulfur subunit